MEIEMRGINKSFGDNAVLKNAGFVLSTGEIHALMGENGAGKSTLMKILTGVYTKDAGQVIVDGQEVCYKNAREAEKAGIVFIHQELNVLFDLTVEENMFLGKEIKKKCGVCDKKAMRREGEKILKQIESRVMEFVAIIPARYASTRFPGKPLAMLGGKPVIRRVYEQVTGVLPDAVVATDDERILRAVEEFGGRAVMTSAEHRSGTDRCWEAYGKLGREYDAVINVQGDEPFIRPEQLRAIMRCFDVPGTDIATLVRPFAESDGLAALENPNSPKVVLDGESRAIYFSRSVIPYLRGVERSEWLAKHTFYKHIGMYAFRTKVLAEVTALPQSSLEKAESLEQLRWLENGYRIGVGISDVETIGIDTPEDLAAAEEFLKRMKR